eukprot:PLAT14384.1.p2 GENE.PLAT14384.1~~PLAT14384.1.p2  ORF type:complete len:242 (-),score=103.71 PLAT14384.1:21-746(-)
MVFTGIVEEKGAVLDVEERAEGGRQLLIGAVSVLDGVELGCSIAVNGTCLTVTAFTSTDFTVELAPETVRRTNLGDLCMGDEVNLERSLAADGRNSGHMVQGHVDGCGELVEKWEEGDSLWLRIALPPSLLRYIVEKGYVAVDGTSLTVCSVDRDAGNFTLMLIPFTQKAVILPSKAVGDKFNIEVDVVSKYVERSMTAVHGRLDALEGKMEKLLERLEPLLSGGGGGGGGGSGGGAGSEE